MANLPHVRTNLGNVRPHTLRVAEEIANRWTIHYMWGIGGSGHHAAGRALDIMTLTRDQSALRTRMGNEIAAYLQDHAGRLGILYIIWRQRIWNHSFASDRSRTSWSQWRRMADRGSPTENHMDHVHVSFDANPRPYRAPDGSTPSGGDGLLRRGDSGAAVRRLQDLLNEHNYELTVDGQYGPRTEAAVRAYQRANGLEVDGIAGPQTLGHLQEDDMPSVDEYAKATAKEMASGRYINLDLAGKRQARSLDYALRHLERQQDKNAARLEAQAATIDKLVDAVAAGPGVDVEALKAEIREAIESITVRLDVEEEA